MVLTILFTFSSKLSSKAYTNLGVGLEPSSNSTTFFAISMPPSPPFSQHSLSSTGTPKSSQRRVNSAISALVSVANLLIATNTGTLK